MVEHTPFPLSTFESVRNPNASETVELYFDDFVEIAASFADDAYSSKEAASLFATTKFKDNRRSKANATISGMGVLDVDDGQSIEVTWEIVKDLGIAALLYSTASHRQEHHKFRLCIPLLEPVEYEKHCKVWHSLNHVFLNGESDGSKIGCESLFYVPGQYPDAPSVFETSDGDILSADEWIALVDIPEEEIKRNKQDNQRSIVKTKPSAGLSSRSASSDDLDFYETKLITEAALGKYQSAHGNWHNARFGLMMSIAGRASKMGIAITQDDIINLFNQVDMIDGGHYQTSKYQNEIANDAAKALASAA